MTYILYAESLRPMYPSKKIDKYNYYLLIPTKTAEAKPNVIDKYKYSVLIPTKTAEG